MEQQVRIIKPAQESNRRQADLRTVESFSRLLDSKFTIPGTSIKFGLDPIISLFPVFGDLISYAMSGVLIYTMYQKGASRKVVIKMIINSSLDALIGSIPILGSVFDFLYRSNDRNVRLLKEHYYEGKHQGSGNGLLVIITIIAVLIVFAAFYGVYKLAEAVFY